MMNTHHPILSRLPARVRVNLAALIVPALVLLGTGHAMAQQAPEKATLLNRASGSFNGSGLDTTAAVVSLNRVGYPATLVLSEITPNEVMLYSRGTPFTYDILPMIEPGDVGIEEVEIRIPEGFENVRLDALYLEGAVQDLSLEDGSGGAVQVTIERDRILFHLAQRVTVSEIPMRITFTADAMGRAGETEFTCVLKGSGKSRSSVSGDADGDPEDANLSTVTVQPGVHPSLATVLAEPSVVLADGVSFSTVTTTLLDGDSQPVSGKGIVMLASRGLADSLRQPEFLTDGNGVATGTIRSKVVGLTTISVVDTTDRITLDARPQVAFTRGGVLEIFKEAGRRSAVIGDLVPYRLIVRNTESTEVTPAFIHDRIPPNFKYLAGSARMNGEKIPDPAGNRLLSFDLGTVPGLVDANGNGRADSGEPGFIILTYELIVGSGAEPGEYANRAVAVDACDACFISNFSEASVTVTLDPLFDLATIIGKVFHDADGDGRQSRGETGVAGVMVALDDGTYTHTDEYGRYHFKAVLAGHRLVKVDLNSVPGKAVAVTDEALAVWVTPGIVAKANFGLSLETEFRQIGEPARTGFSVLTEDSREWIKIVGSVETLGLLVNGEPLNFPACDIRVRGNRSGPGVPPEFVVDVDGEPAAWRLDLWGENGDIVGTLRGTGTPPKFVTWDASSVPAPSAAFLQYQLEASYPDGTRITSPRRSFPAGGAVLAPAKVTRAGSSREVDGYRTTAGIRINGDPVEIQPGGTFHTRVPGDSTNSVSIRINDSLGRSFTSVLPIPTLSIFEPTGEVRLEFGAVEAGRRAAEAPEDRGVAVTHVLRSRTEPGNQVEVDGERIEVGPDGSFETELELETGGNTFGILVRDPRGLSRIVNLFVRVQDRDENGDPVIAVDPIPNLAVNLPPAGATLGSPEVHLSGTTDPGNVIQVNGETFPVDNSGRFVAPVKLPAGTSLLSVQTTDPRGNTGTIEREVAVAENQIFLMAFADGVMGRLEGRGYLEGAGMEEKTEFYTEGRIAYYLKARVSGRYLITSAFDTGRDEFGKLFENLDDAGNERLLTNLDPDRFYPVYGDNSQTVYDTDSQGKFFLAVDSDEFNLVVGNYALSFSDNELASYQRTLYGERADYRSASRTPDGKPTTSVTVFGARGSRAQVRIELRATGGSLYYLPHQDVVEGSEQVSLVVRDKDTGLILSRQPQVQNVDYTVKYIEGRIWFNRPVSSVIESASIVDTELLSGHPVFIEAVYETDSSDEVSAHGGRVRQQIGDRIAVGGTYVKDNRGDTEYELKGADAEARLGGSRITGEYVETAGFDSLAFISDDGGISYHRVPRSALREGSAWKATAELDVGEWFGERDAVRVGGYYRRVEDGFFTGGNLQEGGSEKVGVNLGIQADGMGDLAIRHDRASRLGDADPGTPDRTTTNSARWSYNGAPHGLALEYRDHKEEDAQGKELNASSHLAARLRSYIGKKLTGSLEHQRTLTGSSNDQTTLGLEYKLREDLVLRASGTKGSRGEALEGGLTYVDSESGLRVYVSERVTRLGHQSATVFGAERELGRKGRVYTEHQWLRTDGESKALSMAGASQDVEIGHGFRLQLSTEHTRSGAPGREARSTAFSTGLAYTNPAGVRVSTRNGIRFGAGTRKELQYLSAGDVTVNLNPDYSILGKFRYSVTQDRDEERTDATYEEYSLGLAYRPVATDRLNGLARYTRLMDQRPVGPGGAVAPRTTLDILSLEGAAEIERRVEVVEKFAAKAKREAGHASTHTYLSINRLNFRLWDPFDFGVEYRILFQTEAHDRKAGWLNELTWAAATHLRLGLGYNFTDFSDSEFSENDYSVYGWFLRMQGKY